MAWWVNQTPATGDAAVYGFVDMLLHPTGAAPWTVPTSGDASVYAQSGNVIASAASLVPGAWLVLRSPAYYVSPSSTTPRACPSFSVDCGFLLTNTSSTAAQSGLK